ncbi:class I SAM-dependent methyltransferase [Sphingomonas naphthae]|uniref:Class I SAM-dependent methyltransferase n=1 Tax=Sphingomonas naphthae TaxID=1813468 RepID=A0ABY7TM07_9SPHN|nr:class I SAM-dependent methyltransferase [Sphingomonas naphthae]WCT73980.1 class I SAM-dependent methyltransferase [Sphingomonas naphthae]
MTPPNNDDPVQVQANVFGGFAEGAAEALLGLLGPSLSKGVVVDVACGAGLLAERIAAAGYDVRGGDLSSDMVNLARQRVPAGRFLRASIFNVDLPPARAIVAVGEVVNRQCEPRDEAALDRFVRRAHAALERGGILLFDAAAPGRAQSGARGFAEGPGWAAGTVSHEPGDETMTRTTTLFTASGDGWHRHEQEDRLSLWPREAVAEILQDAGFTVEAGNSYGRLALPPGLIRYTAQK